MNTFKAFFKSDLNDASDCLSELITYIETQFQDVSQDTVFELRLIFSELFYNAVIHGNKLDRQKLVRLEIKALEDGAIRAVIEDEGEGFDHVSLLHNLDKNNLSESGRGIQLVHGLCDFLTFNGNGSKITFLKRMELNNAKHINSRS